MVGYDQTLRLFDKKRSVRERLYGEDLRMHTRRLISDTLTNLNTLGIRLEDLNSQITAIPDIPANAGIINTLKNERAQILVNIDKLNDSVRATIKLH